MRHATTTSSLRVREASGRHPAELRRLGSRQAFPPRLGEFGFQAAIHVTALRIFQYNPLSWLLDEPGDWNLCRRMLEAGVRMGWVDQVVSRYYPGPFVLQHRSSSRRALTAQPRQPWSEPQAAEAGPPGYR